MKTAAARQDDEANETQSLDCLSPAVPFLSFDWRTIGEIFSPRAPSKGPSSRLTSSISFHVREGYDPLDKASTGAVIQAQSDLGIALRNSSMAASMTATGITFRLGMDDPLRGTAAACSAPSVKATLVKEFAYKSYLSASYDLKLRKPEVSLCFGGSSFQEKATLSLTADPVNRALRMDAVTSFPGWEWRETVYNEELDIIELPKDDGGRHSLRVHHEARMGNIMHQTQVGLRVDIGRIVNVVCDQFDYLVEPRVPPLLWTLPASRWIYNLLVPPEDEDQVRHHIKGWELDTLHDFARSGPQFTLSKTVRYLTASASWDMHSREAGAHLALGRNGALRLGMRAVKEAGSSSPLQGWTQKPTLYMHIDPLQLIDL